MGSTAPVVLFAGYSVLCTSPDGSIGGGAEGLFHHDARLLSRHRLVLGGERPALVHATQTAADAWRAILRIRRPGGDAGGPLLPQDSIEVDVQRTLDGGVTEALTLTNHSAVVCETTLRLELDSDVIDILELKGPRRQHGRIQRHPEAAAWRMSSFAEHEGRRDARGLRVKVVDADTEAIVDEGGIAFAVRLAPHGTWHANLWIEPLDADGQPLADPLPAARRARQREAWRARRPVVESRDRIRVPFERAADDLFDLRNSALEARFAGRTDGSRWVLNAGLPMFTGLFGRDSITAAWQSMLLGPRAALGTLDAIAATQATRDDPWRDAEPGKLIHELRDGPLSRLGISPRDAYYGSHTTPAMFVLALSEAWHWTGDSALIRRHLATARRAMDWARDHGDLDGDGFLEYQRRSPQGLRNQAWKDSDEAIRHADGRVADGPIATVEEQAFHVVALERMAELSIALGDDRAADADLARARDLRRRWHDAFWMPEQGFYALALDGGKRQVRSVASNPGHALGCGVIPQAHARAVADRLLAPDLWSGWGVRSLSSDHPSYDPFAYHLGAVWPVEQATFALGCKRYGLDDHVIRLATGVLDAAAASRDGRLPEALSGHARGETGAPVPYPEANSPQAWSASAIVQLLQILLGIYPFAPLRILALVRPALPPGVDELTLRRLRVGDASVDLRFQRRPDGSVRWRVERRRGRLLVLPAGPPDDLGEPDPLERAAEAILRAAPGRLARAARAALGHAGDGMLTA